MQYNYKCSNKTCNKEATLDKSINDPHITLCPFCGQHTLVHVFAPNPTIYKCRGFPDQERNSRIWR